MGGAGVGLIFDPLAGKGKALGGRGGMRTQRAAPGSKKRTKDETCPTGQETAIGAAPRRCGVWLKKTPPGAIWSNFQQPAPSAVGEEVSSSSPRKRSSTRFGCAPFFVTAWNSRLWRWLSGSSARIAPRSTHWRA